MNTTPVFRFAPSPNGELHLGHAYSALMNAQLAQAVGGRLLLRVEDIDVTRCTPEFEAESSVTSPGLASAGKNRSGASRGISVNMRRCCKD